MTKTNQPRLPKEGDKCPRCGTLFLFNNRTFAGVCDNCWNDEVQKAQRRLAKKYGGKR
jgi:hypothetical protein